MYEIPTKTKEFLFPCLSLYGENFKDNMKYLHVTNAYLIDDLDNYKYDTRYKIYIKINTEISIDFNKALLWLKSHESYLNDYSSDSDLINNLNHVLVLRLPTFCYKTYEHFINGNFSKMYSSHFINYLFKIGSTKDILLKQNCQRAFIELVNKEFNTKFKHNDFGKLKETALPIKIEEERFKCFYRANSLIKKSFNATFK
jgi:hypothetical protein